MGVVRLLQDAGNHAHDQEQVLQAGGESTNGTPLKLRTPSIRRPHWGTSGAPTPRR